MIDGDSVKKTRIGTEMNAEVEMRLVACLRSNCDIFAWSMDDLRGIDPKVSVHRLNMDQQSSTLGKRGETLDLWKMPLLSGKLKDFSRQDTLRKSVILTELQYCPRGEVTWEVAHVQRFHKVEQILSKGPLSSSKDRSVGRLYLRMCSSKLHGCLPSVLPNPDGTRRY